MSYVDGAAKPKLRFSDLALRTVTLEVRYEPALYFWDRAGQIWEDIRAALGNVKLKSAEPGNTSFDVGQNVSVTIGLEAAHITSYTSKLDDLSECAEKVIGIMLRHLRIASFTRVGGRFIYVKDYPDAESAASSLLSLGNVFVPSGKHFGIAGGASHPEYKIRWEGEATGIYVQLGAFSRKLEFEAPRESKLLKSLVESHHVVSFDLDYYTRKPVEVEKLRVRDWLDNVVHLIRRDSRVFFERAKDGL